MRRDRTVRVGALLLGAVLAVGGAVAPAWASHEIVMGLQCDRTGPTNNIGPFVCPGAHDYVRLVNARGGVEGHRLRLMEIDIEYKVPPAIEAYERFKKEGAVVVGVYGTPQTYALAQKLNEDRIPGTAPGFGIAASKDGSKYPYVFPVAASYWAQVAGAVKFAKDTMGGLKGKKIAYLFYDNPAGREPIPILEDLQGLEGFQLKTFAVPPPGVEMGAQALDIAQRYRADFVVAHLFGKAPSVSIKELRRVGFPLKKVVSMVWGSSEADIEAAGGWAAAEGYSGLQFAGAGPDFPVLGEIRDLYRKEGKEPPREMASTVFYNRGVFWAAIHVEAIRNALRARPDGKITPVDVKNGFERIQGFTLGGLVPPLRITPEDHEGGGLVQVYRVQGGKFVKATDWFSAYADVVNRHVYKK